jgi:D-lactate dehydrogenase
MKVGVFEIEEWEKEYFTKVFGAENVFFSPDHLTLDTVSQATDCEIISVFIYSELTKELLEKLPNLKCITTRSTGFDQIDVEYCREKEITVCNVPEYGTHSVAEHTFALLLSITRNLIPSIEHTRKGNFDLTGLSGVDLFGQTLGIIGFGNIGKHVSQIAKGFGMKCVVTTYKPNLEDQETYGVTFVELPELLKTADIVTLHVPLNPETTHMLNRETFAQMKKGTTLLNTARGGLIDTQSLVEALDNGMVRAAGIDVLEEEVNIKEERQLLSTHFLKHNDLQVQLLNHVLLSRENVLITPHNAFNSQESLHTILKTTLENIQGYIDKKPINCV